MKCLCCFCFSNLASLFEDIIYIIKMLFPVFTSLSDWRKLCLDFLPSVFAYIDKVAATAVAKKSVVSDVSTASEGKLIKELSQLADEISTGLETLKADTAKALATEDPLANAKAYQTVVLSDMDELRKSVDAAETLIPDALLPYPTYDKLLFSV